MVTVAQRKRLADGDDHKGAQGRDALTSDLLIEIMEIYCLRLKVVYQSWCTPTSWSVGMIPACPGI